MNSRLPCIFLAIISTLSSHRVHAETAYELQVNSHYLFLDISEKRGLQYSDDFSNIGIVAAAYRQAGKYSAWGAALEYATPLDRNAALGDGTILGFRPVNYLLTINKRLSTEVYLGAAQYNWEKTARGYFFGANLRLKLDNYPVSLAADYRFHQDMAYDSDNGDVIIQGSSIGTALIFHF